jgi:predicted Zn-dependent protease
MPRIEDIEQLLASSPEDVFLQYSLAMELLKADRRPEAIEQFNRVLQLDPNYVPALVQQAEALLAEHRRDEAKAVLAQGVEAAKNTGDNHAASKMQEKLNLL